MIGQPSGGIFIGGMDRSGTTLLQSMLNAHPSVMVTYEARLPISLHGRYGRLVSRNVPGLIDAIRSHSAFRSVSEDAIRGRLPEQDLTFADVLCAAFEALSHTKGKSLWGDKCPDYATRFSFLGGLFPDSRLIHIYRDPRGVAYSLIGKSWGPQTALHAAQAWLDTVTSAIESIRCLAPHRTLAICYESLVSNPTELVGNLCSFLQIEPHAAMFDGTLRQQSFPDSLRDIHPRVGGIINTSRMDKWSSLPRRDIETIEAVCGHLMDELGYERITAMRGRGVGFERRVLYGMQRRWRALIRRTRRRRPEP